MSEVKQDGKPYGLEDCILPPLRTARVRTGGQISYQGRVARRKELRPYVGSEVLLFSIDKHAIGVVSGSKFICWFSTPKYKTDKESRDAMIAQIGFFADRSDVIDFEDDDSDILFQAPLTTDGLSDALSNSKLTRDIESELNQSFKPKNGANHES